MKKHFVKNANYRRFMTAIARIERRGAEESSLILLYGPPGVGKTRTVNHYGAMTDAITVPGMHDMNVAYVRDCLKDATGIDAKGRWAEAKALKQYFAEHRYPIIFDEAQHGLTEKAAVIEYLRAITDHAEVPLVLVCHTSEAKRFSKHDHQATRIGCVCELEVATQEDADQYIAELIRWVSVSTALPQDGELVLLWTEGDDSPWMGYLDGVTWRSAEGFPIPMTDRTHWASMPTGPAPAQPIEARHEEAAA